MNFKPTLWKSVVSTLIGFIAKILFIFIYTISSVKGAVEHNSLIYKLGVYDVKFPEIFIITIALIVYIIWSLFQKKK
ncbi:MAG: hypothetical protein WC584_00315 [Candidatus Pacearchaeota archaeon]